MKRSEKTEQRESMTKICYECRHVMEGVRENYNYGESGLKSVVLMNVLVFHCKNCGAIVPEIPAVSSLHRAITMSLLQKKSLLAAEEIRFIRKVVGYNAVELSGVMGLSPVSVSRWETGKRPIGKESDRLFRLVCFTKLMEVLSGKTGLVQHVAEVGKMVRSLNLTSLLQEIEDKVKGPEKLRIDPSKLEEFSLTEEIAQTTQMSQVN